VDDKDEAVALKSVKKTSGEPLHDKVQSWREDKAAMYRVYARQSVLGLEVGLSVVVGVLLGVWADKYFGSAPWGLLAGLFIGIAAGIRKLVQLVKQATLDMEEFDGEEKNLSESSQSKEP